MRLQCSTALERHAVYDILATDAAGRDLDEIRDYLLNNLCNPQTLESLIAEIREAYETIRENPRAFPACDDARLSHIGYRKCMVGRYLFIYRVDDSAGVVHVIRFFHELQNYLRIL